MTDRGQTEVVGYLLIFSVVVLTVALVTVSGQAGLTTLRDGQRTANVEAGFSVLADNVDDIVRDGAPSRSTELGLSGERLSLGAPVTVNVTATNGSGVTVFDRSRSLRPVVYRSDDGARLVYSNGAVFGQGTTGGVAVLREPSMLLSADRAIVPLLDTRRNTQQLRGSSGAISRESQVLVRTEHRGSSVLDAADDSGLIDLEVTVTSPRATAWEASFTSNGFSCTLSADQSTVTCTLTTNQATLVLVDVAVSFE